MQILSNICHEFFKKFLTETFFFHFQGFFISSAVEVPSYFVGWYLMDRWGRRWILFATMMTGGISCISCMFVPLGEMGIICTELVMDLDRPNLVKLCYGGLVLGLSQFSLLPQLPQKMMLASKVA